MSAWMTDFIDVKNVIICLFDLEVNTLTLLIPLMLNVKNNTFYEKRRTEQREMKEIKGVTDELLKVHGIAPGKKGEGETRVIYENPNGFNSRITCNEKLEKDKEIIDEM